MQEEEQLLSESLFTPQQFKQLRQQFELHDKDHDGLVDKDELRKVILEMYSDIFSSHDIDEIVHNYENQKIDFYKFVGLASARRIEKKYEELEKDLNKLDADTANARYAFALFDADDSGFINKEELKHMLKLMHKDDSEQNVQQLMNEFDTDHDNVFSFEEFRKLLKKIDV